MVMVLLRISTILVCAAEGGGAAIVRAMRRTVTAALRRIRGSPSWGETDLQEPTIGKRTQSEQIAPRIDRPVPDAPGRKQGGDAFAAR